MTLIHPNRSSLCVRAQLVHGRARTQAARCSTRVAAESFDGPRNGQGNGPSPRPSPRTLDFEAQKYATVLSPRAVDPADDRDTMKLDLLRAISGVSITFNSSALAHKKGLLLLGVKPLHLSRG